MSKPVTLWRLGWLLLWHHIAGWRIKPGCVIVQQEDGVGVHVAVCMERPDG
ncbi:hypothetical protein JYP52_21445 [Nitratireductor aquibiodomus]|uniref:hypothetical protein n=1 Tax=Nitratireductor aquibiodomus TaxID=204799 RepID=UPI0019D3798B|nr:hypothetical protein [Nitratireductor aquibiodomus]MBN7763707.1 hypothetical protein [Nitratireductor aquibiodomus]